jgi:hypothetical protein
VRSMPASSLKSVVAQQPRKAGGMSIEQWQKKDAPTITVMAVRLTEENATVVAEWSKSELIEEIDPEHPEEMQPGLNVRTPGGTKRASLHMYVVKFGNHFFAEHNRAFELVYEPVGRPSPPPESAGDARRERGFGDPFDLGRMGP